MFVNDKIIYLQLQKTGCTHIARLLTKHLGGDNAHKHARLDRDPAGRPVIGSVRDPWDWYVSLWAYGCMGKGAIETRLTTAFGALALQTLRGAARRPGRWPGLPGRLARRDTGFWRRVYADASDRGAFRDWLHAIHDPAIQAVVFEDDRPLALHNGVGLYTARLVYLYSDPAAWDREAPGLADRAAVEAFFGARSVLQRVIRTERIAEDLAAVMQDVGRPDLTANRLAAEGRTNTSQRDGFETYHDADSIALIAERDAMIVDRFGYAPPQSAVPEPV